MTTQPPDPGDEQPQAGDVPPPDPNPPAAPPPGTPASEYPPLTPPQDETAPQAEAPTQAEAPPQAGYAPMPPAPVAEYGHPEPGYAVPAGMYFDAESGLLLPQGTQLATVGRRIGAFFLSILLWIVTLGIGYIIWGLIVWANGQTPALQVLGMRCWRPETRQVAGWWWMALREIAGRVIDNILGIFSEIASLILMVVGRERKALHDWVAGTVVLHDPDKVLPSWPPVP